MNRSHRIYRWRKATITFFCPLCRSERFAGVTPRLSALNMAQLMLLTILFTALTFPFAKWSSLASFFFFWAFFEGGKRFWFKKQVPCPHCGFDAVKYRKDVKACRAEVLAFWQNKNKNLPGNVS